MRTASETTAENGAPEREPEVWDERIDAYNPRFGHGVEPVPVVVEEGFDVGAYLRGERAKDLLRFSTAGSVDDGKSTLIGRLLYDTQSVYEDQVRSIEGKGTTAPGVLDLALLTDGLRAEREQGITIDVAYRYFSTARRKFIIADTPGHEQYTRNMATGASTADLAVVLVDARKGVLVQSRRHACIAALLGVRQVVVAVNKMDLVGYDEGAFTAVREEFGAFLAEVAGIEGVRAAEVTFVPVSALVGDNVVRRTEAMPWYSGPSLLEVLEGVPVATVDAGAGFRMAVQRVLRPDQDFRGFAGQIAAGAVRPGDAVMVLPSRRVSRVARVVTFDGDLAEARAPQSVTVTLEDEVDVSRGDLLVAEHAAAGMARRFRASLVWMDEAGLEIGRRYLLKHMSRTVQAAVTAVEHRLEVATLERTAAATLGLNGIGQVVVEAVQALAVERYAENRRTGSFVLIDPLTNATVAAGMVREVLAEEAGTSDGSSKVTAEERAARWGHAGAVIEIAGPVAFFDAVERELFGLGAVVVTAEGASTEGVEGLVRAGVLVMRHREAAETGVTVAGKDEAVESAADMVRVLRRTGVLAAAGGKETR